MNDDKQTQDQIEDHEDRQAMDEARIDRQIGASMPDSFMKSSNPVTGEVTDHVRELFPNLPEATNAPRQVSERPKPVQPCINDFVRVVPPSGSDDGIKIQVNMGERWLTVATRNADVSVEADRVALAIKNMAMLYGRRIGEYVVKGS